MDKTILSLIIECNIKANTILYGLYNDEASINTVAYMYPSNKIETAKIMLDNLKMTLDTIKTIRTKYRGIYMKNEEINKILIEIKNSLSILTDMIVDVDKSKVFIDNSTKIMWVRNPHTDLPEVFMAHMDYYDAVNAIVLLNEEKFLGYSDWRLPSINELQSLIDYTKHNPATDKNIFNDVKSDWYWSSTIFDSASSARWLVGFSYGNVYSHAEANYYYVRPCRAI